MKKSILHIFKILIILYIVVCGLLYFIQEKLIFFPDKLKKEYKFGFNQNFEELYIKTKYDENRIIVLGYSVGTGLATKLASLNHSKLLILQAPYFSLTDMMKHNYPIIPTFILKYKFETNNYIKECKMPIVIFHGDKDEVIYYESSLKLKELIKETDTLIILNGQGHNGMSNNTEYLS